MSVNSSSSSSDSLLHSSLDYPFEIRCLLTRPGSIIFATYILFYVPLLLPLSIFVIYYGFQQWKKKRSISSAASTSHSDSFTYNMVIMVLIRIFGFVICFCGIYREDAYMLVAGYLTFSFTWFGEMYFHVLTCVERYLAVVHPIAYLSLRKERGIRIRNISIGCVWLLCFVSMTLINIEHLDTFLNVTLLILSLSVVSFCSVSVLRVLIRPGPGDQDRSRERVDQSKQRAFYTIMVILGVLVLKFTCNLAWAVFSVLGRNGTCAIMVSGFWLNMPSSLVLPLLFLYRAEKVLCCKNNIQ